MELNPLPLLYDCWCPSEDNGTTRASILANHLFLGSATLEQGDGEIVSAVDVSFSSPLHPVCADDMKH